MLWMLLSLFAAAAVAPILNRAARQHTGWLLGLLPLGITAWSLRYCRGVTEGATYQQSHQWAPSLQVNVSFALDGLSLVFVILICVTGALVLVYASQYLRADRRLGLFYGYLLFFMASMLGLVLADNVFVLFVFWELTSVSSFLLIGWNHEDAGARKAAQTALLVTGGGGMLLLAGLVLLTLVGGNADISKLSRDAIHASPLYPLTLALVLGGALTKSAQFPFHFWLPGAMAAPTPVSAYLHSATMVKAGIYLLARLHPTLGGSDMWFLVVTLFGAVTMLMGAVIAIAQTDLKRILAYATVSVLGTLTMLLGIGTKEAIGAAVAYLLAHSLYKGALFLVAGVLDHEAGTRDIRQLRGMARCMPVVAVAAMLAAASGAGLPPLLGFLAKERLYEAAWHAPIAGAVVLAAAFLASTAMVVVALMVAYRPFYGRADSAQQFSQRVPWRLSLGPIVLATAGLLLGLGPGLAAGPLEAMAAAAAGESVSLDLRLWHGLTPLLGLSALTLVAGVATYIALPRRWRYLPGSGEPETKYDFQRVYDRAFLELMDFAAAVTRIVQNGYLRNYVLIVVVTLVALLARPLVQGRQLFFSQLSETRPPEVILAAIILLAAIAATAIVSRLAVAAILGAIGIAVMLLYVIFGALDLAVTQIMVETLTVILLVLVLYHLPKFVYTSSRWVYLRDAVVSLVFGGMIALLVIKASAVQADPELRQFYAARSYLEAHGRNVVNVILVDFRATDTMGEVTVLAAAAIGVVALLRLRAGRRHNSGAMVSLVLRATTPVLMLLLLVVSIYALLRGHHESGGGFIGGLLAAAAFSLHALAHDVPSTRRLLGIAPQVLMGLGLVVIAASGAVGLVLGTSFLQGQWIDVLLPGLGDVRLGTPLLFDSGVYAVVMGMVLTIVLTAAEE